jgi:hypothetical protein
MAKRNPDTPADHFEYARHHEEFLGYLSANVLNQHPEYADWALVVCFYAALHYTKGAILRDHNVSVERHTRYRDEHHRVHDGHNELVREHLGKEISAKYQQLFGNGHDARYRGFFRKPNEARLEVALCMGLLDEIKAACDVERTS